MTPVTHWKQAKCVCGHAGFEVELLFQETPDNPDFSTTLPYFVTRCCVKCGDDHTLLYGEGTGKWDPVYSQYCVCLCDSREYEVVGVTAPSAATCPDTADWFYLMLRCARCGCLGLYAYWQMRYTDYRELLALL
jgi:hypothetical protein